MSVRRRKSVAKKDAVRKEKEPPRVGQMAITRVGTDQYAGTIERIEGDIIFIREETGTSIIRCKKNSTYAGYGEQIETGLPDKWKFKDTAKYRYLSTWHPIEGIARTVLDPHF